MTLAMWRVGGLIVLMLGASGADAAGQDRTPAESRGPERRLSVEGAAGLHVYYRGSMQSVAVGFAPSRSLTLLISAERSHVKDDIDQYEGGYAFERGERICSSAQRYGTRAVSSSE